MLPLVQDSDDSCTNAQRILWALIDSEAEIWGDSHKVVKDIGLLSFIDIPYLVTCEEIHLYREAIWGGLLLSDYDIQILIHIRVLMQITLYIKAVKLNVCKNIKSIILLALSH